MSTTQTLEQELLELETQYWVAIKDKNAEAAMDLTDNVCLVTGAQGAARIDRRSLGEMMKSAKYTLDDFLIDSAEVVFPADDVAVVVYKVHEELTVEGKNVQLDAADASTWIRRNGQWKCALHTESILGDPFGRDRHPSR